MTIAVLGSAGQLGRDLCPLLPGHVQALTRADADLARPETVTAMLDRVAPTIVINCAAYNLVDQAEKEPEAAFAVNAWGVRALARECQRRDIHLVQISSDYVFGLDSQRIAALSENDPPGPVSVYGLSKLAGEYLVRSICSDHLIIRTCGLYGVWGSGGKGGNFVETMLRVAGQGKPLRVVNDQWCTPSYTRHIARTIVQLVERRSTGLIHVTNSEACNWFEFASEIFRIARVSANLSPIPSSEYAAAARRPPFSVLSNARLESLGLAPLPSWKEALREYLAERSQRKS